MPTRSREKLKESVEKEVKSLGLAPLCQIVENSVVPGRFSAFFVETSEVKPRDGWRLKDFVDNFGARGPGGQPATAGRSSKNE